MSDVPTDLPEPSAVALREPANRVSPRAQVLWGAGALVSVLLVLAALVTANVIWFAVPLWGWLLYAVLAIAYVVGMPVFRYRVHRWESTETAVYTQTGWLSRERRIAPMSRVQTVDFHQTAFARLFDLASVTVTTASSAGPVQISGIERAVADRLVDDLTRRAEAETGDAT